MNESGTSRMSGLEKRLGDRGLNLLRRVICRDIEPLAWLLCPKTVSASWSLRGAIRHTGREKDAQMELRAWCSVPSSAAVSWVQTPRLVFDLHSALSGCWPHSFPRPPVGHCVPFAFIPAVLGLS